MLIEILLEDLNLDVKIAKDGLEAEKLFQSDRFDLVLLDINMPNKNGIDAMKSIKEYESDDNKTPIIALTADAVSGDKQKYLEYGFDDYLAKPIDNEELLKMLRKYVS